MKTRKFIDQIVLHASSGRGGNGSASFRREKFIPKGGPDGGDGGRGGHVILRGDANENSLVRIYFEPIRRAEHGDPGRGQGTHGRNGDDLVVRVPCGTEVHDAATGVLIGDITTDGQDLLVAKGGKGGKGNVHFKSSTHQAPMEFTEGEPGQDLELRLTLKLVADLGLVGYPNAGKSSLLSKLSDAHPKVAAYPFTTLNPVVGTMIFEDFSRLTIADIPGLIKGAHEGVGLGHDFLRHIERARLLVYVVDMAGVDGRKPVDDFSSVIEELRLHREDLGERPSLLVANKMDLAEAEENLREFCDQTGENPIRISTVTGEGIPELRKAIGELRER